MEQKFLASERNRKNHVKEVINKQLEREKKARKVREKSCVELEGSIIHVDETYSSGGDSEGMVSFALFLVHTKTSYYCVNINSKHEVPNLLAVICEHCFQTFMQPSVQAL